MGCHAGCRRRAGLGYIYYLSSALGCSDRGSTAAGHWAVRGVTWLEHDLLGKVQSVAAEEQSCCRSQAQVWLGTPGGPPGVEYRVCYGYKLPFWFNPACTSNMAGSTQLLSAGTCSVQSCTGSDMAACNAFNQLVLMQSIPAQPGHSA